MKVKIKNKKETESKIDFSKPQLLISEIGNIVMCLGEGDNEERFTGVSIESEVWGIGDYANRWIKEHFKPFKGKIILEND